MFCIDFLRNYCFCEATHKTEQCFNLMNYLSVQEGIVCPKCYKAGFHSVVKLFRNPLY